MQVGWPVAVLCRLSETAENLARFDFISGLKMQIFGTQMPVQRIKNIFIKLMRQNYCRSVVAIIVIKPRTMYNAGDIE